MFRPMAGGAAVLAAMAIAGVVVLAQKPDDPFPQPIAATEGVVRVGLSEFAALPDIAG